MEFFEITPMERAMLARIRFCPEVFLGEGSLRNFRHMAAGYQAAMRNAGLRNLHNLLPDGLNEFTASRLNISHDARDCFSMIAEVEQDDTKALMRFFEILDAYLVHLGTEPLPVVSDWERFRGIWPE